MASVSVLPFSERVIAALHREALALADETGAYFTGDGRADGQALSARARLRFAGEGLKATTRVMQVIAWTAPRSSASPRHDRNAPTRALPNGPPSGSEVLAALPPRARQLIVAGMDLHERAARIAGSESSIAADRAARGPFQRLESVR